MSTFWLPQMAPDTARCLLMHALGTVTIFGCKIHGYVKRLPLSTLPAIARSPVVMRYKPMLPRWQTTHQVAPAHLSMKPACRDLHPAPLAAWQVLLVGHLATQLLFIPCSPGTGLAMTLVSRTLQEGPAHDCQHGLYHDKQLSNLKSLHPRNPIRCASTQAAHLASMRRHSGKQLHICLILRHTKTLTVQAKVSMSLCGRDLYSSLPLPVKCHPLQPWR